jgi:hypothetical protein
MSSFWHSMAYIAIAVVGGALMDATRAEVFIMAVVMFILHEVDAMRGKDKP